MWLVRYDVDQKTVEHNQIMLNDTRDRKSKAANAPYKKSGSLEEAGQS